MSTTTTFVKSSVETNRTAVPAVRSPAHREGGILREAAANAVPVTTQDDGTVIVFNRVPSNGRISQLLLTCIDFSSAGAADFGVHTYNAADDTYTAVDSDFFATAVDLSGGPMNNLDITNESGTYTANLQEKMLWEVLGTPGVTYAVDPKIDFYITATVTTDFSSSGTLNMILKARWVE